METSDTNSVKQKMTFVVGINILQIYFFIFTVRLEAHEKIAYKEKYNIKK